MKRVRVLKYLPKMSIGDEFLIDESVGSFVHMGESMTWNIFYFLFDRGYFEWVEEDNTLEEKFMNAETEYYTKTYKDNISMYKIHAKIAKEHYQKKFNEAIPPGTFIEFSKQSIVDNINKIRKALFGEK